MERGTEQLAKRLLKEIHTAKTLKAVSETLESLTQHRAFKDHATNIATDPSLTSSQKKTQLMYLIRSIEIPLLYQFFTNELEDGQFWLFSGGRIDYFDRFVQDFQKSTEMVEVVQFETAVPLNLQLQNSIAQDLSESFGMKVVINHQVTPSLTGGIRIKIENILYDFSLHAKYVQFQRLWIKSLKDTEKAIGRNIPE
jgi:F0F1-type ATP synthase delta subunit